MSEAGDAPPGQAPAVSGRLYLGHFLLYYEKHPGRGAPPSGFWSFGSPPARCCWGCSAEEVADPLHPGLPVAGGLFGVFLFIAYTTQTFGLTGTTPSKNAFLTATYCVLVPFLAWRVFHRRPDQYNLLAAFLCITGVGLVSLSGDLTVTWGTA